MKVARRNILQPIHRKGKAEDRLVNSCSQAFLLTSDNPLNGAGIPDKYDLMISLSLVKKRDSSQVHRAVDELWRNITLDRFRAGHKFFQAFKPIFLVRMHFTLFMFRKLSQQFPMFVT